MGDSGQGSKSKTETDRAGHTSLQTACSGLPGRRSPSQLLEEEEGREHPTQEPRQVGAQNGCGEVEGITSGGWPAAGKACCGIWRSGRVLLSEDPSC